MKKVWALVVVAAGMTVPAMALAKRAGKEVTGTVNLNQATEEQLELLPGIGPKVAKEIVAYRAQKQFEKPADIRHIKGVGKATFTKIKDHLAVSGKTTIASEGGSANAEKQRPSKTAQKSRPELEEMED
jgi:competence protein ComEA